MTSQKLIRIVSVVHRFLYRLTGGAIGGGRRGSQFFLLLTTTGRKTGKERTVPLLYLPDGENMVVVGSNGGADRDPSWWVNLKHNPRAKVQVGRPVKAVRAEKARAEERARLWPLLVEAYPGYDGYEKRLSREIPVVILRPDEKREAES
jgi:deazaflavin-dependent oxidoreductase (nitroreductase family)